MFSKKYSQLLFVLIMGFLMILLLTLIITFVIKGMDHDNINRFLKAGTVSLLIPIGTELLVGPFPKNFVKKVSN